MNPFRQLSRLSVLPLRWRHLFAGAGLAVLMHVPPAAASFAEREDTQAFIQDVASRHGFDPAELQSALARATHEPAVIRLITPPSRKGARSWQNYRARFLDRTRIEGGLAFWQEHAVDLERAERQFGVPAEVIVAIIGVETVYGRHTGNFETLSALATLAFDYPPRADLFRRELESLFLLAREQGRDPASYSGSFAGAVGFLSSCPAASAPMRWTSTATARSISRAMRSTRSAASRTTSMSTAGSRTRRLPNAHGCRPHRMRPASSPQA